MESHVARYELDDGTAVAFEFGPAAGFRPAGVEEVAGRVRDAVEPAVRTARTVLERVRESGPDEVAVKFGVKVTGKVDWIVAKAATEGNFEVTLTWKPSAVDRPGPVAG
ncbi:MAG: CU044_2847 family protein [Stackebrandtia sp.]